MTSQEKCDIHFSTGLGPQPPRWELSTIEWGAVVSHLEAFGRHNRLKQKQEDLGGGGSRTTTAR
jgi:hypothetical protein